MSDKVLIAPSILSADFSRLGEEVLSIARAGADWVHIDVMDGCFVPNITIGPCVVRSLRGVTQLPLDVHLMIADPIKFVKPFADAGADIITFHVEACDKPEEIIAGIKKLGKKAGISVKPGTDIKTLAPLLKSADMVLVMTVEPGFGGQSYMASMVPKIKYLKENFKGYIQVDGGINQNTAKEVIGAGANVIVAGTAVFGEKEYGTAIRRLRGE